MNVIVLTPIAVSFLIVVALMPFWIRKAKQIGLLWDDMNKWKSEKVAGSGGVIVLMAFIISVLIYVAYLTFFNSGENIVSILALLITLLFVGGIGLIDDLLGWRKGGLSRRSRLVLVLLAAIPLIAIKAGDAMINLPILGMIELGWIYPLILVPLGIIGTTATFNFLAGFNGLEAGSGIILLTGSAIVAYFTGSPWLAVVLCCMIFALLAFLTFNWSPARVFPGDVITYPIGALIACAAIIGNFEKIAFFFFIPIIIEVILKARGKLVKSSFGKPKKDGSLEMQYDRIYGLTNFGIFALDKMGIKPTEKRVVFLIWAIEILFVILGFLIFKEGIFI